MAALRKSGGLYIVYADTQGDTQTKFFGPVPPKGYEQDGDDSETKYFISSVGGSAEAVAQIRASKPASGLDGTQSVSFLIGYDFNDGHQTSEIRLKADAALSGFSDGVALVTNPDSDIAVAYDVRNGDRLWEGKQTTSNLAVTDGVAILEDLQYNDGNLVGHELRTGAVKWRAPLDFADLRVPGGDVSEIVISQYGRAKFYDTRSGKILLDSLKYTDASHEPDPNQRILYDPETSSVVFLSGCGGVVVLSATPQGGFVKDCGSGVTSNLRLRGAMGGLVWAESPEERFIFDQENGELIGTGWTEYPSGGDLRLLVLSAAERDEMTPEPKSRLVVPEGTPDLVKITGGTRND